MAPVPGGSGVYAHLASQRSEVEARAVIRMLRQTHQAILSDRDMVIRRADLAGQGTFYRVEVGPLQSAQADGLCASLKAAGSQCVIEYE